MIRWIYLHKLRVVLILGALLVLISPVISAVLQTEGNLSDRFHLTDDKLPQKTTELMGFFSIEKEGETCLGTAAKQLGTELAPENVVTFLAESLPVDERHSVAWFENHKVVVQDVREGDAHTLSAPEFEELPLAARFLLNIHAFLPKGVRRVVLFSREELTGSFEPRCW